MINGNVKCDNYQDIVKSYQIKHSYKFEKTPSNLFNAFISGNNDKGNNNYYSEKIFPKSFIKFMKEISTIFTKPKRYTILISRRGISDNSFNKMFEQRKKTAKYILNENIKIHHTNKIDFLNPKKNNY